MTVSLTPAALRECCAARAWVAAMAEGGPYRSLDEMRQASDSSLAQLSEADIDEALAAHPRIGERAASAWSRQEQSGVSSGHGAALAEANAAYERRFGWVFLICATGLSGEQILAALTERLGNDAHTERAVVREELRKIVRLRLEKAVAA